MKEKDCKALREYADFVQMVRAYYKESKNQTEAIKKALEQAIHNNYLDGYFKKEKEEVFMTTLLEVDWDIYENGLREEGREESRREIIFSMYKNGISIQQIATIIQMDIKEVEKMLINKN